MHILYVTTDDVMRAKLMAIDRYLGDGYEEDSDDDDDDDDEEEEEEEEVEGSGDDDDDKDGNYEAK
jgi:hypothetical protein